MDDHYTILVAGRLPEHWAGEFHRLTVCARPDGTTILRGRVRDQAELHGHIRRIEALGLALLAVQPDGGGR